MKTLILAGVSSLALATSAFAAEVTGSVSVDVAENAAGNYGAETGIDMTVSNAIGNVAVGLTLDNGDVVLDGYSLGTTVRGNYVAFGDQGDVFDVFEGGLETVGGSTLANPADDGESITVNASGVLVNVGFTDVTNDVTDIENVQVAYGTALGNLYVDAGIDYNLDTEEAVLGVAGKTVVSGYLIGAIGTYDSASEVMGYELSTTVASVTAFVDGDSNDMVQNIGAGYKASAGNMDYYAEAAYNFDAKEITPAIGISFSF